MPFASDKQRRFMFAKHPEIAKRWTEEARENHEPAVQPHRVVSDKQFPRKVDGGGKHA